MMKHIEPNGGISVPLEYAAKGQLQFRPWGLKYEWSHMLSLSSLERRAGLFGCKAEDPDAAPYVYAIQIDLPQR